MKQLWFAFVLGMAAAVGAEVPKAEVRGKLLRIGREDYPVLMLPGVDAIPYDVLVKAKEFLDAGGVVASHAYRPSQSATVGRTDAEVQALVKAIFGSGNPRALALAPVARPDLFTPPAPAGGEAHDRNRRRGRGNGACASP